jgi:uncharacterized damage-inducible protein DinB
MTHEHASGKEAFLRAYEREHDITMRVLRAFPAEKLDFRPHELAKSARELAWVFVVERSLGEAVFANAFADGPPSGGVARPEPPNDWNAIVDAVEAAHRKFAALVQAGQVKFFVAPKTLGNYSRMEVAWFLLHDEIHHRGQFSVYLRMSGAKVPSIYGPTRDEPWM